MTWRDYFYWFSLITLWSFFISGVLIRREKLKDCLKQIKKDWMTFLVALLMPQFFILLVALNAIIDFKDFKEFVKNNYK